MRIIFLDIDGVVATNRTYKAWRRVGSPLSFEGRVSLIDPSLVALVNDFGTEIGASVVVSSSWRDPEICPFPIEDVLRAASLRLPIVGQTSLPSHIHRGLEINSYIVQNGLDLSDLVAFDDDRYAAASPRMSPVRHGARVILTPEATGINAKYIARARKLF